ncbi:hypothetical protein S40293_00187 [Stachybotrys chartarum IBT 40293]|nr:hypothetical protein S40293_00187 [Stachybotrys chartarum IBT 40293]KFA72089.1 hypothetical protein S40288_02259 [Stachybotrys chartarum IBT 40288]
MEDGKTEDGRFKNGISRDLSPTVGPGGVDLSGLDGLTLEEKKCVLVQREINRQGMGRYQWYVWALCGFGYFIDLMWAQAFGLVLSPLQQELGFGNGETGNISIAFSAGLTAGAFFWGFMSDVIGRRWAFNLTCLIASIFGLCLGASNDYNTFLVLTAFIGVGVGGNIPIDTTITLEFIPSNRRFLLACLSMFQPIGVVICSAIALGFIPPYSCSPNFSELDRDPLPSCNNVSAGTECCTRASNQGWRYLLFTLGGITLGIFILRFFVFRFKESPKFLIYKGRDVHAMQTVEHIAKVNKQECHLSLEAFKALEGDSASLVSDESINPAFKEKVKGAWRQSGLLDFSRYKMLQVFLFSSRAEPYVLTLFKGSYLPRILALKNGALNVSLEDTYTAYVYTYFPGIFGVLLGAAMYRVPAIGRKWTMVFSSALMGTSIFLFAIVDTRATNEGMFTMEYFFQSMFNAVLYGWTPEAFPTPVRGLACGTASTWGRLFGIISPIIAQNLYARTDGTSGEGDINSVLYLAGGVTLGCVISVALLPNKLMEAKDERS